MRDGDGPLIGLLAFLFPKRRARVCVCVCVCCALTFVLSDMGQPTGDRWGDQPLDLIRLAGGSGTRLSAGRHSTYYSMYLPLHYTCPAALNVIGDGSSQDLRVAGRRSLRIELMIRTVIYGCWAVTEWRTVLATAGTSDGGRDEVHLSSGSLAAVRRNPESVPPVP